MKILNALDRLIQYIKNPTRLIGLTGYNPKKKKQLIQAKTPDTTKTDTSHQKRQNKTDTFINKLR